MWNLKPVILIKFCHIIVILTSLQTDSINSASSLDDGEAQVVIQSLQEELIMVRLREAENSATIKQLRNKIDELEQVQGFCLQEY